MGGGRGTGRETDPRRKKKREMRRKVRWTGRKMTKGTQGGTESREHLKMDRGTGQVR